MSGLEKMIAKMNELPQWEKISRRDNEFGEVILFYYNSIIDVTCKIYYNVDQDSMEPKLALFKNGRDLSVWKN